MSTPSSPHWRIRRMPRSSDCAPRSAPRIRATDPRIGEDIKWNAPSFHLDGRHFATMQLRRPDSVLLVLHLGAGRRVLPAGAIADPTGLLTWLGADRATLAFRCSGDVEVHETALQALLRQWMAHL